MWLRVAVDGDLVVRAIESASGCHPLVAVALKPSAPLQSMVGASMVRGWRQSTRPPGRRGRLHASARLLFNLATATFQTINAAFKGRGDEPPRHLGPVHRLGLPRRGRAAAYPRFYRRGTKIGLSALVTQTLQPFFFNIGAKQPWWVQPNTSCKATSYERRGCHHLQQTFTVVATSSNPAHSAGA